MTYDNLNELWIASKANLDLKMHPMVFATEGAAKDWAKANCDRLTACVVFRASKVGMFHQDEPRWIGEGASVPDGEADAQG